jgi:hypothetical protein
MMFAGKQPIEARDYNSNCTARQSRKQKKWQRQIGFKNSKTKNVTTIQKFSAKNDKS